jgi:tetratricopeptide (TPR) repeat protein
MHQITRWYVNNSSTGKLEFDEVPATDLGKVMNFGEWSELIALPILFKKLFLLAEAGTAEVEDSATREAAYSHLKVDQIPKPVLYFEVDGKVSSTWDSDQEQSIYAYEQFPHVANQGWIFQDADAASLAKTFRLFYDGMKRAQYSLTEGFQRNFTSDWSGSWDRYTLSAALMVAREQKQIVNGAGFWCPQIFTGVQSAITTGKYNAVRQPGQKSEKEFEEMVEITNTGMGSTVTAAINTLAFGHLLAKHEFELAARVLELAHLMHVPAESWNALSNWGIILYMTNDLAGAEEKFDKIIEESGGPSHDEAYAYKAAIAQLRGDTEAAAKYQALSDKAGPYNSPIFEQTSIKTTSSDEFSFDFAIDDDPTSGSSLTKNSHSGIGATSDSPTPTSSNSGGQRANYCGECGSKFDSAEQNFCGECGSKRQ